MIPVSLPARKDKIAFGSQKEWSRIEQFQPNIMFNGKWVCQIRLVGLAASSQTGGKRIHWLTEQAVCRNHGQPHVSLISQPLKREPHSGLPRIPELFWLSAKNSDHYSLSDSVDSFFLSANYNNSCHTEEFYRLLGI